MDSIKEQLGEVTYNWCQGQTFEEICKSTDSFEGSIIRTLRRLDELLKQMENAAKVIGNKVFVLCFRIYLRNFRKPAAT